MKITKAESDKKRYLTLLLLADEQETMIDRYLERGDLYVMTDDGADRAAAVCVVTDEGEGVFEVKNVAVDPGMQRRGLGRRMLQFAEETYKDRGTKLQVGTGDVPDTVLFYEACGFVRSHVVKNFFTDHYDHPIFECGTQLIDMVYLSKSLSV